jgi:hypothetical protein
LTAVVVTGGFPALYAADDFGDRFGSAAPTALDEQPTVQDIEPAAGDEAEPAAPATPANVIDITAPQQDTTEPSVEPAVEPAIEPEGGAKTDAELEAKMGTDVQSSTQELGEQTQQHDSVGEGKVRAFYKTEQDGRIMDNNDAAGVEVKVLEFK